MQKCQTGKVVGLVPMEYHYDARLTHEPGALVGLHRERHRLLRRAAAAAIAASATARQQHLEERQAFLSQNSAFHAAAPATASSAGGGGRAAGGRRWWEADGAGRAAGRTSMKGGLPLMPIASLLVPMVTSRIFAVTPSGGMLRSHTHTHAAVSEGPHGTRARLLLATHM